MQLDLDTDLRPPPSLPPPLGFQVAGRSTVVVKEGGVILTLSPFDARNGPAELLEQLE